MPPRISRRELLQLTGLGAAAAMTGCSAVGPSARKPNVIAIIADDLGYADIGAHGCTDIPTPNIDAIAANGVRFTSAYAGASVCSPSRACLMTGRLPCTFGYMYNPFSAPDTYGLPVTETTLGDVMKAGGYRTGLIGKWHLGNRPDFLPTNRGFDEFFGFPDGPQGYQAPDRDNPKIRVGFKLHRNTTPIQSRGYLTDTFTREACAFIERYRDEPFFLIVAHQAAHVPLGATQQYLDMVKTIVNIERRHYAAAITALDAGVGQVIETLKRLALYDDTLVYFLSDNGGSSHELPVNNGDLRGDKANLYEGGIRVPFLMQWPSVLHKGVTFDKAISAADILPTSAAAAGFVPTTKQPLDGVNLLPHMKGENSNAPHERLFWAQGSDFAMRKGDWKLIANKVYHWYELFNLAADQSESTNLAKGKSDKLAELTADLDAWAATLPPPLWGWSGNRNWTSDSADARSSESPAPSK